jgi:hypothetical protein
LDSGKAIGSHGCWSASGIGRVSRAWLVFGECGVILAILIPTPPRNFPEVGGAHGLLASCTQGLTPRRTVSHIGITRVLKQPAKIFLRGGLSLRSPSTLFQP